MILPENVQLIVSELAKINAALSENARNNCGKRLGPENERWLDEQIDRRTRHLFALGIMGYELDCGTNIARTAPAGASEAAGLLRRG